MLGLVNFPKRQKIVRLFSYCSVLLLMACTQDPLRARHTVLGLEKSDLLACAGVPDAQSILPDGEVLEWRQDQPVQGPFTLKAPFSTELDLGGHGTCHVIARMRQNRVVRLTYTGPSVTWQGSYGACWPLVAACDRLAREKKRE